MKHEALYLALAILVGIGLIAIWIHSRRMTRQAAKQLRQVTGASSHLVRTIGVAIGITGFEWLIVMYAHDWRVLLVVLGIPALLAGRTVTRMFAIADLARGGDR